MYSVKNVQNILKEIKFRIAWILFCFLATSICSYIFSEELLFLLAKPFLLRNNVILRTVTTQDKIETELKQYHLQENTFEQLGSEKQAIFQAWCPEQEQTVAFFLSTQLTETLNTYLTTSFVLSCFFCIPYLLYQAWCFFIPSCYVYERNHLTQIFFLSLVFCFATFYFCLTYLLPNVWYFLYEINRTSTSIFVIQLQPKIYDFIMLTIQVLVSMFICSQTLVIFITLIKYKKIRARDLIQHRKFVIFFAILLAALITPPDLLSQFCALFPFLVVIESMIFYSILCHLYDRYTN